MFFKKTAKMKSSTLNQKANSFQDLIVGPLCTPSLINKRNNSLNGPIVNSPEDMSSTKEISKRKPLKLKSKIKQVLKPVENGSTVLLLATICFLILRKDCQVILDYNIVPEPRYPRRSVPRRKTREQRIEDNKIKSLEEKKAMEIRVKERTLGNFALSAHEERCLYVEIQRLLSSGEMMTRRDFQ